jgi:hypothetical protein
VSLRKDHDDWHGSAERTLIQVSFASFRSHDRVCIRGSRTVTTQLQDATMVKGLTDGAMYGSRVATGLHTRELEPAAIS